jgi:hypothetical protein
MHASSKKESSNDNIGMHRHSGKFAGGSGAGAGVPAPFAIEVVDVETGRGVPLVELEDGQ